MAIDDLTVVQHGQTYRVAVRRHAKATRFTLRIRAATRDVVLTAPMKSSMSEACKFASEHAEWIHSKLLKVPDAIPFQHGSVIPIRGVEHQIVHVATERGLVSLGQTARNDANINQPLFLYVSGHEEHVERRTRDFLRDLAKGDIRAAVKKHSDKLNIKPPQTTIRDTVSRWGSCSSSGALNFSWRLIFAPAFVLDYLAAHEVSHILEMNHSKRFWIIVKNLCPETAMAEKWLDVHGPSLHRFGAKRTGVRALKPAKS
jgi:predicted metal-dependent hydrolase